MRKLFQVLISATFLALTPMAFADVQLKLTSPDTVAAGNLTITFQLLNSDDGTSLSADDLNVSHEKKLHFIIYDPGLREFQHVHPEFNGGQWSVDVSFLVDGQYFVWAQGELASNSSDFNAGARLEVGGGQPAWPAPSLSDVRSGEQDGTVATLSGDKLRAGKTAMLMLTFTESDGSPANISPYLGAFAHVIATPADGSSLLHVHPMDGGAPNEGMLHVNFPAAGFYRIWVQFIDGGVLKTVPLSVQVF